MRVGPLVKSQSLYLLSGTEGSRHWDFPSNINTLIKCHDDEVMRVSLTSVNVYNSYQQINEYNNIIRFSKTAEAQFGLRQVRIPVGTYTYPDLAAKLTELFEFWFNLGAARGLTVTYDTNNKTFTIDVWNHINGSVPTDFYFSDNLNMILGFSKTALQGQSTYTSDRAPLPHGVAELVVELFGLTAAESAAPVSNYTSAADDVDLTHVLAVIPAGPIWERTVFYNNEARFCSFLCGEKAISSLRVRIGDRQGRSHTWITHPVGIGLLFETFKRA